METIGFIGGGNMSTAIAKGILKSGEIPASRIWVSGPNIKNLKHWQEFGANVTTKNGEVYCKCNIVFLGVKPTMLNRAVQDCIQTLTEKSDVARCRDVLFISMLAGVSIGAVHEELGTLTSHARVIRIMPNTPITVGAGVCLYTPDSMSSTCTNFLERLLSGSAVCTQVPEPMMDSLGALIGCGPAYMYIVIEALADGAVKQGVPRDLAQKFAAQMMLGSAKMVLESGKHPGLLKDEVCSPGGSTIAGVSELENGKIRATFINAIEASSSKNKVLGKKN